MLRPTQSAIIFVQQLGRGLRKHESKEYVNVIDFIGNYDKNFLIPIALSGDTSYNKDNLRKYLFEGNSVIPGCSTINFDPIAKKMIFKNIDETNFSIGKFIKESYKNLKARLGRIPSLMDFEKYNAIDILKVFEKYESYYNFLVKSEPQYTFRLSELEALFMRFISDQLVDGKRPHELVILEMLLKNDTIDMTEKYTQRMLRDYNITVCNNSLICSKNILTGNYLVGPGKNKFLSIKFLKENENELRISENFMRMLQKEGFKLMVQELLELGFHRNKINYINRYEDTNFVLNQKYTYEDVFKLLNWQKSKLSLNVGGYEYDKGTNTFPVFINYQKEDGIKSTINYHDRFISESQIIGITKSAARNINTPDIQTIYENEKNGVQIHLFIRSDKKDKESKAFYYLGKMKPIGEPVVINGKVPEITYQLEQPVEDATYNYITHKISV